MRVPGDIVRVASWSLVVGFIVGLAMSAIEPDPYALGDEAYGRISVDVAVAQAPPR